MRLLGAVTATLFWTAVGLAQECDQDLLKLVDSRNPVPYKKRLGRCEGLYDPERMGDATLLVVSYTIAFDRFDVANQSTLRLRVDTPIRTPVHIKGYALRPRTYYQMDSVLEPSSPELTWPLDVVRQIGLERRDLAILGWLNYQGRTVYVPVDVAADTQRRPADSGPPRLVLHPGRRLSELYLTVARLKADLTPSQSLLKEQPLGLGTYPADERIPITLSQLKIDGVGFYSVTFGASVVGGSPATLQITLFYPQ